MTLTQPSPPWRCLLPRILLPTLLCEDGRVRGLAALAPEEKPATLFDEVITAEGSSSDQEAACQAVAEKLWELQEIGYGGRGMLVVIVPDSHVGMIVGQRGSNISKIMQETGAELVVASEKLCGLPLRPLTIIGTLKQAVAAASAVHTEFRSMVVAGKVSLDDFSCNLDPGAKAGDRLLPLLAVKERLLKVVVTVHVASFLIGRGGKRIKQLQEDSGARLTLRQGAEAPRGLDPDDRMIEVRGRREEQEDGVYVIVSEADRIPEALAGSTTRILAPGVWVTELAAEAASCGAEVVAAQLRVGEDRMLVLGGTLDIRIEAANRVAALIAVKELSAVSGSPPALATVHIGAGSPMGSPALPGARSRPEVVVGREASREVGREVSQVRTVVTPTVAKVDVADRVSGTGSKPDARLLPHATASGSELSTESAVERNPLCVGRESSPCVDTVAKNAVVVPPQAESALAVSIASATRISTSAANSQPAAGVRSNDGVGCIRLLLPSSEMLAILTAEGFFVQVSARCGVAIWVPDGSTTAADVDDRTAARDLRDREIRLTGSATANALALLQLQWRLATPSQGYDRTTLRQ